MTLLMNCQCSIGCARLLLGALSCLCLVCIGCSLVAPTAVSIENDVLHFSYELERLLDVDKSPCRDFHGYVCGRSMNTTRALREQRKQQEQQRFEKFMALDNDEELLDMEHKLKIFYKSCQQARGVDKLNSTQLYRATGGWPAIENGVQAMTQQHRRRTLNWLTVLAGFHEVGATYFFETRIEMKSNKRVVMLQPDNTMRYTLRKFEQLLGDIMAEYKVAESRAPLVALEVMNFERNRRDIAKADVSAGGKQLEYSYADLKTTVFDSAHQLDWDVYFRRLLGKSLKPTDTVIIRGQAKLVQYFELLQNTTMNRLLNWIWIDYLMEKTSGDCQLLVETYFAPVYAHIAQRVASDKVVMAQMYANLGRSYDELLPKSVWIDEISQQNSKQFSGRIIHLTLNGDEKIDTDYNGLAISQTNFYQNLEILQRFLAQQRKTQSHSTPNPLVLSANEYMQIFRTINALLQTHNLTAPLNYMLAGERFAARLIAGGSSTRIPGAWRSMDSEREFSQFSDCNARQSGATTTKYNANDLLLKLLAQKVALHAYEQWLAKEVLLQRRIDSLLLAGRLQLSLKRLYFVASALVDCYELSGVQLERQKQLLHGYLRNSPAFTQTFNCHTYDELYAAQRACKVL